MLFANSSWAGNGYDNAYHHNAAYQQSHQQLLVSSQRLSQRAADFSRYVSQYGHARDVRRASRALQAAADDLYYQIHHGGDGYKLQYAYDEARAAYYGLRDCFNGSIRAINRVGYAVHDVERDYQRYQRLLARNDDPYQRKAYNQGYRGHGNAVGIGYRSGGYSNGLNLQLRVR
jgi:hypothetical protein